VRPVVTGQRGENRNIRPNEANFRVKHNGLRIRASVAAVTTGVLAAASAAAIGGQALAAPQPSVGQVQQKVNTLTSEYDQASQQYDQAVQDLSAARAKLSRLNKEIARDQANFKKMRGQVAQIATISYEDADMTSVAALLTSGNPQAVLNQASLMLEMAGSRNQEMKLFLAAARKLSDAQQQAQRTEQGLASLEKQKEQNRQHLGTLLANEKATLASLTASQRQQVAAASIGAGGVTAAVYTGPTSSQADKAVAFAYAQLGKPYQYGATGPDAYDCSGLVQAAWAYAGVSIPRTTYEQWSSLPHVPSSDIQPGDLLFFDGEGHVGIYVGGGDMIDAPQTGQNVERVPINSPWYAQNFDGAARP